MIKPLGEEVFNPLDKTHLAESVKDHLLKRPVVQLPPSRFVGAWYGSQDLQSAIVTLLSLKPCVPYAVSRGILCMFILVARQAYDDEFVWIIGILRLDFIGHRSFCHAAIPS